MLRRRLWVSRTESSDSEDDDQTGRNGDYGNHVPREGFMDQILAEFGHPDIGSIKSPKLDEGNGRGSAGDSTSSTSKHFLPGKSTANHKDCDFCSEPGDLIFCDRCPASFHLQCYFPPLEISDIPPGLWICRRCEAVALIKQFSDQSSNDSSPVLTNVKVVSDDSGRQSPSLLAIAGGPSTRGGQRKGSAFGGQSSKSYVCKGNNEAITLAFTNYIRNVFNEDRKDGENLNDKCQTQEGVDSAEALANLQSRDINVTDQDSKPGAKSDNMTESNGEEGYDDDVEDKVKNKSSSSKGGKRAKKRGIRKSRSESTSKKLKLVNEIKDNEGFSKDNIKSDADKDHFDEGDDNDTKWNISFLDALNSMVKAINPTPFRVMKRYRSEHNLPTVLPAPEVHITLGKLDESKVRSGFWVKRGLSLVASSQAGGNAKQHVSLTRPLSSVGRVGSSSSGLGYRISNTSMTTILERLPMGLIYSRFGLAQCEYIITKISGKLPPPPQLICYICLRGLSKEDLLVCDHCPRLYHIDCLPEPLFVIPHDFMCPAHLKPVLAKELYLHGLSYSEKVSLMNDLQLESRTFNTRERIKRLVDLATCVLDEENRISQTNMPTHHQNVQVPEYVKKAYQLTNCEVNVDKLSRMSEKLLTAIVSSMKQTGVEKVISLDGKISNYLSLHVIAEQLMKQQEMAGSACPSKLQIIREIKESILVCPPPQLPLLYMGLLSHQLKALGMSKPSSLPSSQGEISDEKVRASNENSPRIRATLLPITRIDNHPLILIATNTFSVGTDSDCDLCLPAFGFTRCNYIDSRHADIFIDLVTNRYHLLLLSPYGVTVDNVYYTCDGSNHITASSPQPPLPGINPFAEQPLPSCSCTCLEMHNSLNKPNSKPIRSTFIRLNHGSYIRFGCVEFLFSILPSV